jgi:hypothetical protein
VHGDTGRVEIRKSDKSIHYGDRELPDSPWTTVEVIVDKRPATSPGQDG